MPVRFGLVGPNGSPMSWSGVEGATVRDDLIVFDSAEAEVTFTGVANKPVPSLLRGFSAPVVLDLAMSQEDRLFLARHDSDPFNRWQALQDVGLALVVAAVGGQQWSDADIGSLRAAMVETLENGNLDHAFKSLALTLPAEAQIARAIGKDVDPDRIHAVRRELVRAVFAPEAERLRAVYHSLDTDAPYAPDAAGAGRRALRNRLLGLLVASDADGASELASGQYHSARNMTDRLAALSAASGYWTPEAATLLADFRSRYAADPLVLDKWLALNAVVPDEGTVERLRGILADPSFPRTNPNRLRALMGSFALGNPTEFIRSDGAGFRFVADFVAEVDKVNPQVAARVLTGFRVWQMLDAPRREAAKAALIALQAAGGLSRNTADILTRMLAG